MTFFLVIQTIPSEAKWHLTAFNQFCFYKNEQTQTIKPTCLIKKLLIIRYSALL